MHPTRAFRQETADENLAFARARSFGVLAVNAETGPLISHVPFRIADDGASLEAHLIRVNPIVALLDKPVPAVIAVSGADAYVSPDWYGVDNQVPTWNYVAVHLRGHLRLLDQDELPGILDRLSETFETRLAPKPAWTPAKMDEKTYANMRRAIVPVAMTIDDVQGTWKLSQNKPDAVRLRAADGLEGAGFGHETAEMVRLMRVVGED